MMEVNTMIWGGFTMLFLMIILIILYIYFDEYARENK